MENNKGNAMIIYILAIFIWFISPVIFYYIKKDGTEYERENARKSLNFEIVMTVLLFVSDNNARLSSIELPVPTIKLFARTFPEEIPVLNSEANFVNSDVVWLSKSFLSMTMMVRSTPDLRASNFVATKLVNVFPDPVACQT